MFAVRPRFGRAPVPEILADAMRAALEGTLPLAERLRQREADYRQDGARLGAAADLLAQRRGQRRATGIVEVRAGDRAGLLYRLTAAITEEGLDVTSARIETLGADAVDSFYVCNPSGSPVDPDAARRGWTPRWSAATRARDRRPAGARRTRRLSSAVLSVARATVGGRGTERSRCRRRTERSSRGQPLLALPDL